VSEDKNDRKNGGTRSTENHKKHEKQHPEERFDVANQNTVGKRQRRGKMKSCSPEQILKVPATLRNELPRRSEPLR
jgi:hypothetical protein